jgi:hypothetical protein
LIANISLLLGTRQNRTDVKLLDLKVFYCQAKLFTKIQKNPASHSLKNKKQNMGTGTLS